MILNEVSRRMADGIMRQHGYDTTLKYLLPPFRIQDLTDCILMEFIKTLFEETMPKRSVRFHLKAAGLDDEADQMRFFRILQHAQHYRSSYYDRMVTETGKGSAVLLPDDMSTMQSKKTGYQLTAMQFFELDVMSRCPLIKYIARGRVSNVKSVSNEELRASFKKYSEITEKLRLTATDDEKLVFNTLALYTLEWNYGINLAYEAICQSEQMPGSDPFDAVKMLVSKATLRKGRRSFRTENRFVYHRKELLPQALGKSTAGEVWEKITTYLWFKCETKEAMVFDGRPVLDYLREKTTLKDWAEFIREYYPILNDITVYDWTNKRLRTYRKLAERMFEDVPPPKSKK